MIVYTMLLSLCGASHAYVHAYGPTYGRGIPGHAEKMRAGAWRGTACAAVGFAGSAASLNGVGMTVSSLVSAVLLTCALRSRGTTRRRLHVAGYIAGLIATSVFCVTILGPTLRAAP